MRPTERSWLGWPIRHPISRGDGGWGNVTGAPARAIAQQNLENLEDVTYWRDLCDLQAAAGQSAQESSRAAANPETALALYAEAQMACERAIELAPEDDSLWARHSGILLAQDQYPNAIARRVKPYGLTQKTPWRLPIAASPTTSWAI